MEGGEMGRKKDISVMKPLLRLSAGGSGFFVCVTYFVVVAG
jgi:hypothetical protein